MAGRVDCPLVDWDRGTGNFSCQNEHISGIVMRSESSEQKVSPMENGDHLLGWRASAGENTRSRVRQKMLLYDWPSVSTKRVFEDFYHVESDAFQDDCLGHRLAQDNDNSAL